ncbi:MAG: polysaccharide biosynthesis tyrosine autokinase [Candidatus Zixiibacteriota bacterium]|jgi:capsular exopolysaccharide synthesis family protein
MYVNQTYWSFDPIVRQLARLWRAVWRRRWLFVAAAALPVAATVIYVLQAPDRYAATARVIFDRENESLGLEAAFVPRSNELENDLELIRSRETVVNAASLGRELYPDDPPTEAEIGGALKARALNDTDIVEITTEARDPDRAAALANLVAEAFMDAHLRHRRKSASTAKEFIEKQLDGYEERLARSELALEMFKRSSGVVSLPAETTELIRTGADFEKSLEKTRVDLAVAERKRGYLEDELRETKERLLASGTNVSSPVAEQLQKKLVTLEYRYASLVLKGYGPSHPELKSLGEEIALARGELAEAAAGVVGDEYNLDLFTRVGALAEELEAVRTDVATLETAERELSVTVATAEGRLAALPEKEFELARLTREKEANENIYMLLIEKREEARIAEASEVGTARVFSSAVPPQYPFAPRRKQSLALGVLCGLLFGSAAVAAVEYFDRTVKTAGDAQQVAGANVLGVIPYFGARRSLTASAGNRNGRNGWGDVHPARVVADAPKSPAAEAYRQLYAQLTHLFGNNGGSRSVILGLTSSRAQEGKSTVAANLACSFAQLGTPTLLVDADLEKRTTGELAGVAGGPGLADFLRGEAGWEDIKNETDAEGLVVVGAGTNASASPALLASPRFPAFIKAAREEFDLTLFDVPPVFPVADVALVAGAVKKFIMVVRAGVVGAQELDRAVRTLKQVGGDVAGIVLNCAELGESYGYGYGYYRYYRYGYGRKDKAEPILKE